MLVLSNATTQNGASALFYPDVLEKIGEQAGQNFFILPSSIHETLIVPDDGRFDYQMLESMVKEINAAERVAPEDRLSDSVYHYDSREYLFERAEMYELRQMSKDMDCSDKFSIIFPDTRQLYAHTLMVITIPAISTATSLSIV